MSMNGGKGGDVRMPWGFRRAAAVAFVACSACRRPGLLGGSQLKANEVSGGNAAYQAQNYEIHRIVRKRCETTRT
jgi:hypothetical protein